MLIKGSLSAVGLLTAAALLMQWTSGEASVPADGQAATLAMAPISIGNPAMASAVEALVNPAQPAQASAHPAAAQTAPRFFGKEFQVKSGDTLARLLSRAGAGDAEANAVIGALKGVYNPRNLQAGQTVKALYQAALPTQANASDQFSGLVIPLDYKTRIEVRGQGQSFAAEKVNVSIEVAHARAQGVITSSLFVAGSEQGVPAPVMAELVRTFSWDVDFQRDIRVNDRFEVLYEVHMDEDGNVLFEGNIQYAALTLSGEDKPLYRFQLADGRVDYFDGNGQSAKKALMRTPIDGARLSSGYGSRKHPILGYKKMHKGVDFAAPPGTPIYAAGDGVIEMAGWNGAYGKYVRIRHNSEYATAYAHMKAIKGGIGKGKRVKQGQIIGYVGTTGRSTGPHLHYEILKAGKQTNPLKVKMPSGEKLKGKELESFLAAKGGLDALWASLRPTNEAEVAAR